MKKLEPNSIGLTIYACWDSDMSSSPPLETQLKNHGVPFETSEISNIFGMAGNARLISYISPSANLPIITLVIPSRSIDCFMEEYFVFAGMDKYFADQVDWVKCLEEARRLTKGFAMIERGFVMRVGDGDDYHVEDDLDGVVERLRMHRIRNLDGFHTVLGVIAEGYSRNNYISLFYGTHSEAEGSTPERGLTYEEFDEINAKLLERNTPAKRLSLSDVEFHIIPTEGVESPREACAVLGEEGSIATNDFVAAVAKRVDMFGIWGWCAVEVRGTFGPLESSTILGCYSGSSEDDFKGSDYFNEMRMEVLERLQAQVDELYLLIHVSSD